MLLVHYTVICLGLSKSDTAVRLDGQLSGQLEAVSKSRQRYFRTKLLQAAEQLSKVLAPDTSEELLHYTFNLSQTEAESEAITSSLQFLIDCYHDSADRLGKKFILQMLATASADDSSYLFTSLQLQNYLQVGETQVSFHS